jgi:hypothetical protein
MTMGLLVSRGRHDYGDEAPPHGTSVSSEVSALPARLAQAFQHVFVILWPDERRTLADQ